MDHISSLIRTKPWQMESIMYFCLKYFIFNVDLWRFNDRVSAKSCVNRSFHYPVDFQCSKGSPFDRTKPHILGQGNNLGSLTGIRDSKI